MFDTYSKFLFNLNFLSPFFDEIVSHVFAVMHQKGHNSPVVPSKIVIEFFIEKNLDRLVLFYDEVSFLMCSVHKGHITLQVEFQ